MDDLQARVSATERKFAKCATAYVLLTSKMEQLRPLCERHEKDICELNRKVHKWEQRMTSSAHCDIPTKLRPRASQKVPWIKDIAFVLSKIVWNEERNSKLNFYKALYDRKVEELYEDESWHYWMDFFEDDQDILHILMVMLAIRHCLEVMYEKKGVFMVHQKLEGYGGGQYFTASFGRQMEEFLHRQPNCQAEILPRRPQDVTGEHTSEFKFGFEQNLQEAGAVKTAGFQLRNIPLVPSIKSSRMQQILRRIDTGAYGPIASACSSQNTILSISQIEDKLRMEHKKQKDSEKGFPRDTGNIDWKGRLRVKLLMRRRGATSFSGLDEHGFNGPAATSLQVPAAMGQRLALPPLRPLNKTTHILNTYTALHHTAVAKLRVTRIARSPTMSYFFNA